VHELNRRLNEQYGHAKLAEDIFSELEGAGKDVERLTREDLVTFEEFHLRGRSATRELAQLAGLQQGMRILDVGSGVGGPARTLADEYSCNIAGIDIAWGYCRAAQTLNARTGLSDRIGICNAQALASPFAHSVFDVVWMQHVAMNIEDKTSLLEEFQRLLMPGGRLALYEILAGSNELSHFPLPWASTPDISFLVEPEQLRRMLIEVGFSELHWEDTTSRTLSWGRRALVRHPDEPPPLGLDLVVGLDAREKTANLLRNLEEDRIRLVQAVAGRKP
jgi:2-polyprenyl-3-methyl-5-hydroxy-6-metoxy-1,4-benzoquinol methylase